MTCIVTSAYVIKTYFSNFTTYTFYAEIPSGTSQLNLDIFSVVPINISIVDSIGTPYDVQSVRNTKTNYLFIVESHSETSNLPIGNYIIVVNSTYTNNLSFCNIAIRGVSTQAVYPAFTYDIGYDNGQHSNTGYLAPIQPREFSNENSSNNDD